MKRGSLVVVVVLLLCAGVLVGAFYGMRYLLLGRLTIPTIQDFEGIARQHQPIVAAILDYEIEHGRRPWTLDDLVPGYLPSVPQTWPLMGLSRDLFHVHSGFPHTYVCYVFSALDGGGWQVRGEWGIEKLNVPTPPTTRTATRRATTQAGFQPKTPSRMHAASERPAGSSP